MSEIESVKPILTVIDDEGDLVINSTGPRGKAMAQAVLAGAKDAQKVVVIFDGEMKVMKKNQSSTPVAPPTPPASPARRLASPTPAAPTAPDIQDEFVSDLEAGVTGEVATGEAGKSPEAAPAAAPKRRVPRIYQDAAAPPAPELAEQEMDRLLAEAQQAEKDAAKAAEDRRFQAQQAIQAGEETAAGEPAAAQPRRRTRERALATSGRPCGRCGGGGQVVGDAGFAGACPVCHGEGQVKTWDRALKVR